MDQPGLDEREHRTALRALARLNRLSGSVASLWQPIRTIARQQRRPMRVLDVACGGGDVTIALQRRAQVSGLPICFAGCDINELAIQQAQWTAATTDLSMRFFTADAHRLTETLSPGSYSVAICNLFLHHLTHEDAVQLLQTMRHVARHVIVDDLSRSHLGWCAATVVTRMVTRSPIVHVDGPRSVRAAFTADEARQLAKQAGLDGAVVTRHWPFRWRLCWSRT